MASINVKKSDLKFIRLLRGEWLKFSSIITHLEEQCYDTVEQSSRQTFKKLIDDSLPFCAIIFYDMEFVGYYLCNRIEDSGTDLLEWDSHYGLQDTLYVNSICVLKKYRGIGICSQMMKNIQNIAKTNGFKRISLHTNNNHYKKLCIKEGFRIMSTGIMKYEKHKKDYMYKAIV